MHYTYTTPPSFRAADRPTPIDDALVADARRLMMDAVESLPPASHRNRDALQALFAPSMTTLCAAAPSNVPVEKLIVAVKLAWASMAEARLNFGDAAGDALSGAVSACIEAYFLRPQGQAD
jgi:hypothetical protein